ncbi:MAG: hypothetical protein AAF581_13735 [Planctomycetota bacterium]
MAPIGVARTYTYRSCGMVSSTLQLLLLLCATVLLGVQPANGQGPDVIVGDLTGPGNYGTPSSGPNAGVYYAYSAGTTSCNIGDTTLIWIAGTNEHPVIAQHLYRLKDGRLEQIGMSWLKHGFTALQGGLCSSSCQAHPNGTALGINCSDPYSAGLNGSQGNDNRFEVNAATGYFPYPPIHDPAIEDSTSRRIRVHADDLDPAQNVGAVYLMEAQYVTADDAAAGNHHNNSSYRPCTVNASNYNLSYSGPTVRELAAIEAWPTLDATVTLENAYHVDGAGEGRFILGTKVTDLGTGFYSYEYAVFNQDSDRSGQSFSIPIPAGVIVQNVGFHDVDNHSGSLADSTDWTSAVTATEVSWSTTPYATDPNANALRWGTMYNFRFEANSPPAVGNVFSTLTLFKPGGAGEPNSLSIATKGPVSLGSAPNPVSNLSCSASSLDAILSWTNGSPTYDTVRITRDGALIATLSGTATSYTDPGLAVATYQYGIVGVEGGIGSSTVNCSVDILPPPAPSSFICTANGFQVLLSWTNNAAYDAIAVTRDGVQIATLTSGESSYNDAGLAAATYTYTLTGSVSGISTSTVSCIVTVTPPPPLSFTFSADSPVADYDQGTGAGSFTTTASVLESNANSGFPNDIAAFSIALTHDPSYVTPTALALGGPVAALNAGVGPDFFNPTIYSGGVTAGVLFSFDVDAFLQASSSLPILSIDYDTNASTLMGNGTGASTDLIFTDGVLGSPMLVNNTVVVGVENFVASKNSGTVTLQPLPGGGFIRGDVTGEGSINLLDVTEALAFMFTSGTVSCLSAVDANDDSVLDISDPATILAYLFLGGTIPSPLLSCGADGTPDSLTCDSVSGCP